MNQSPPPESRNLSPQRLERRRVFSEGNLCGVPVSLRSCGVLIGFGGCQQTG